MVDINWFIEGLQRHQVSEFDEVDRLVGNGYCKYTLDITDLQIIFGNKNSEIKNIDDGGKTLLKIGDHAYNYYINLDEPKEDRQNIILINYANKRFRRFYVINLALALGDLLANQRAKQFTEIEGEKGEKHFLLLNSGFSTYMAMKILNDSSEGNHRGDKLKELSSRTGARALEQLMTGRPVVEKHADIALMEYLVTNNSLEYRAWYSKDKYNKIMELQKDIYDAYSKIENNESLTEDEYNNLVEGLKGMRKMLRMDENEPVLNNSMMYNTLNLIRDSMIDLNNIDLNNKG